MTSPTPPFRIVTNEYGDKIFELENLHGKITIEQWFNGDDDYTVMMYDVNNREVYLRGTRKMMCNMFSGASVSIDHRSQVDVHRDGDLRFFTCYDTLIRSSMRIYAAFTVEQCAAAMEILNRAATDD